MLLEFPTSQKVIGLMVANTGLHTVVHGPTAADLGQMTCCALGYCFQTLLLDRFLNFFTHKYNTAGWSLIWILYL